MLFSELEKNRYSVRKFTGEPVAAEIIDQILKAGQSAPTACNLQPQRFMVISGEAQLEKLRKATKCHFDARTAILICYDKNECWQRRYDGKGSGEIDASIATAYMMLEAASLGIGTTWVMHFNPEAVRDEFKLADHLEPVAILPMGYPAAEAQPDPAHSRRKELAELMIK